jgi:hypothetical protein
MSLFTQKKYFISNCSYVADNKPFLRVFQIVGPFCPKDNKTLRVFKGIYSLFLDIDKNTLGYRAILS